MNGDFPKHWITLPLEQAMEAIIDYRGKSPIKSNCGVPLITAKIVKGGRIEQPSEFIAEELYDDWMVRGLPKSGDVVITTEAPLGEVAQIDDPYVALAQRIVTLRGKAELLDNNFLLYLMQSEFIQRQLVARASGSTVSGIKQSELRKVVLILPSIKEQEQIAHHLKTIDNKIALNRQINQTLEAMAQALFKSWFVDFEPVRAKVAALELGEDATRAAMRAISGKTDDELDTLQTTDVAAYAQLQTTASLFPDEFEESELGLVPKGWEVKPFAETITLIGGGTPQRSNPEFWNGTIPWFSIKDLPEASDVFVIDTDEKITQAGLNKSSTRLLEKGTTIITARGTVGKLALLATPMAMNQSCYGVLNRAFPAPVFTFYRLKQAISVLQQNTHGAVFDTITKGTFETFSSVKPKPDIILSFEELASTFLNRIESNVRENQTLSTLRDTLLPKLLSGELTVGETALEPANV